MSEKTKVKTKISVRVVVAAGLALVGVVAIAAGGMSGIKNLFEEPDSTQREEAGSDSVEIPFGISGDFDDVTDTSCAKSDSPSYDDGSYLNATKTSEEKMVKTALSLNKHQEWVSLPDEDIEDTLTSNSNWKLVGDIISAGGGSALQAYVAVDTCEENVVVSFRGSESSDCAKVNKTNTELANCVTEMVSNVLTDAFGVKLKMDWMNSTSDRKSVHAGYRNDYKRVREDVLDRVDDYSDYNIYVTGFSMGAGLATLAALDISDELGVDTYLSTGGSPRIGAQDFVDVLEDNVFAVRVAVNKDPITMIPGYQVISSNTNSELGETYNSIVDQLFDGYLIDYVSDFYGVDLSSKIPDWVTDIMDTLHETLSEPFKDALRSSIGNYDHAGMLLQLGPSGNVVDDPVVKLINSEKSRHTYEYYREVLLLHLSQCDAGGCNTDMDEAAINEREKNRELLGD